MHATHDNTASLPENRLGDLAAMIWRPAAGLGVLLAAASFILPATGAMGLGWEGFFRSYLFAFETVLCISLGGLFFVLLQHCVKAGWSVTVRRLAEGLASNLQWLWIAFIPVAIGMWSGHLYSWTHVHEAAGHGAIPAKYEYYLTPTFWLIRAAVFLATWALLSRWFLRMSVAQDATGEVSLTRRMERWAPLSMVLYAVTQSYASMDWVMSLDSDWFSTMFPVYFFAASCCGFFATLILLAFQLQRMGRLTHEVTTEHYQDMGKLLFAFGIVFWAYIAFSQYMLIWYANIPEEVPFYLVRQSGGWFGVSVLLLLGHFAGPFVAIISRHPKRRPALLAAAAAWMLFMTVVDMYWLVKPDVPEDKIAAYTADHQPTHTTYHTFMENLTNADVGFVPTVLDVTCAVGLLSLLLAGTYWRLGRASLLPEQDPRLHEALAFENI